MKLFLLLFPLLFIDCINVCFEQAKEVTASKVVVEQQVDTSYEIIPSTQLIQL